MKKRSLLKVDSTDTELQVAELDEKTGTQTAKNRKPKQRRYALAMPKIQPLNRPNIQDYEYLNIS